MKVFGWSEKRGGKRDRAMSSLAANHRRTPADWCLLRHPQSAGIERRRGIVAAGVSLLA
ncbi:hypothetical protein [uncultured Sphingomonas sp.]|uniref:hypothetical protein n=1 Tax=uncultured Sphingomonas sp. TaxID=158754 RepID=UPI0037498D35